MAKKPIQKKSKKAAKKGGRRKKGVRSYRSYIAKVLKGLIKILVRLAVMRFLADKPANTLLQFRVVNAGLVVANRIDKETFAVGKGRRHRKEKRGDEGIPSKPVFFHIGANLKIHSPNGNRCRFAHDLSLLVL